MSKNIDIGFQLQLAQNLKLKTTEQLQYIHLSVSVKSALLAYVCEHITPEEITDLWMDMFSSLTRVAEVFLFRMWSLCGMIRDWKGVCGQQMGHGGASCQGTGHCQR